jgi:AraC family transcriptional regulator
VTATDCSNDSSRRLATTSIPFNSGLVGVSLTYYPAGRQSWHSHESEQISFLLAGSLLERRQSAEHVCHGAGIGLKPAGVAHENVWGRDGALILTLSTHGHLTGARSGTLGAWRGGEKKAAPQLARAMFATASLDERTDLLWELIGTITPCSETPAASPPWLERARDALIEEPAGVRVKELADKVGVHRIHFSRMFASRFGMPPSLFRRRAAVARAVRALACGNESLAQAAHFAGFSDQAHMTRALRTATGLTPARLRSLLV